jgi:DNA-binding CsgD family transcriptional regulator
VGPSTGLFDVGRQRLVTPPIRGRAGELKVIGALAAAVAQGRGGVLVIEGPPGIGKSRLLTEVLALADKCGVRTLFGEAFEYQQAVPFFSLFMATLHADPPVGDVEALRRLGGSADLRYWVVHDLADAIHAAAAQTPMAIVLEDIHWADNATLLALRSLAPMLADAPVLWVLTARTGAGGPAVRETLTALERDDARFLRLAAMTPSAVADIVQDDVRADPDASLLNMAAKAHGNPFLLAELLRGLHEEGRLNVSGGRAMASGNTLPRRLSVDMQQRLDGLSDAARKVVQVAAVLPDRFSARLLAAMLERRPTALVSAVEEAVRADLLIEDGDQLRFPHDLLREAVRKALPKSLGRAMERQSAAILLDMGAAPQEVATQLARSADMGDQVAIAALREAAQRVANGDPSAAADLSKRALELLLANDPRRVKLVAETVVLLNRATRYEEAQQLAASTLSSQVSPDEEAQIRLRLLAGNEPPQRRADEHRRALHLPDVGEVTRTRHQAWLAYHQAINGLHGQDRVAVTEAAAAAASTGDLESRILCETTLAILDFADGYAVRAIQRMEDLHTLTRSSEPTLAHVVAAIHWPGLLAFVGRLEDAAAEAAEGTARARRESNGLALPSWALNGGLVHLAAGRMSAARAAIEALPPQEWGTSTEVNMNRMLILAEVAAHTDDRKLLQDMVSEAHDAYATGSPLVSQGAAYVLGLAAWHRCDVHEAARWLGGDTALSVTPLWANVLDQLIFTSRVASAAGDAGLRARVLQAIALLERERSGFEMLAAVAQYARGILERDAEALVAAANTLRGHGWSLLCAGAAEEAGGELARTGRNAEAIDQLSAAFDTYIECEAIADARRVGRALRRLGVERRIVTHSRAKTGWDSLTDSELKVINLIAQGATNRDVATQLHLSPHTVKTHVHNAFAKLGIANRAQLAQLMHGADRQQIG